MEKNIKILVIEDDLGVIDVLEKNLKDEGYDVSLAYDGKRGEELATKGEFDLILMDVMMPKQNGIDLCKKLKSDVSFTTPIIMLTALGSSDNIVEGLDSGADDYVTKPFKFKVLNARIKAILRRNKTELKKNLEYDGLVLNVDAKIAERDGDMINLTQKEFKLLEYFMVNQGRVLSREELLRNVWKINFELNTNVIDVYINYLRNKIDKNYERKYINTMPGHGFVLK